MTTEVLEPAVVIAPVKRRRDGLLWLLNPRLAIGLFIITVLGAGSFVLPLFNTVDPAVQPSQSITPLLTGNWVYSRTMVNEPTANRMKFFLRPRMSVKYALITYPT